MRFSETFNARGHPNIRASHGTTLMITKDSEVTMRGDCIVAVDAEKGLLDINKRLKEAIRSQDARVRLIIEAGSQRFEVSGRGDPRLTLGHPSDMVARRSSYISDRTFMINSDKAARDMSPQLVRLLQDREQIVSITLVVEADDKVE